MTDICIPNIRLRVLHDSDIAFGPGKADLLHAILMTGSISQAAKQMGMSYRRAWQLVDTMNRCFKQPLVATQTGGSHGGGAVVTALGVEMLQLFQEMQHAAAQAAVPYYAQFKNYLNDE